jgi:3-hydroxyisobutyrate dehydrogenase-like beta-hydroxyacid dehydrogenase
MNVGFIGLGRMGAGIAENLIRAGHQVMVWNRSPEPVRALAEKGARAANTPEEALQGEVLFSMLANDAAIRDVGLAGPLLDKAAKGLVHANMATVSIAFAKSLAAAHASRGLGYVATPVFGRPDAAAKGELVVVTGGDKAAVARLAPLLAKIGRRVVAAGEAPEQANLFKIAGNFMIASALETMGEAFALLRKGGVDSAQFHEVMSNSLFACTVFQNYGRLIVAEQYEPVGFALKLGLKDVNLARAAAADLGMEMKLAEIMREHYDEAVRLGWSDKDWSALGAVIAQEAGIAIAGSDRSA